MSPARKILFPRSCITRREFTRAIGVGVGIGVLNKRGNYLRDEPIPLSLVKSAERRSAIKIAVESLPEIQIEGRDVFIKPSFNSPHPFPATTHPDTLEAVVAVLRSKGCGRITLVERSGMGSTRDILHKLGVDGLAQRLDFEVIALDELPASEWREEPLVDSHWQQGIQVPKFLDSDKCLVQVCNLRTHRFGGIYSAGLKNSIGLIAKWRKGTSPEYNYMRELHASPDQRAMIAEVNQAISPELVIMDASAVFINRGPETGDLAYPEAIAASKDTTAIDAVGVALLRLEGAQRALNKRTVFNQDQIKRAVELGLGAKSEKEIDIRTTDEESARLAAQIQANMRETAEEEKKL